MNKQQSSSQVITETEAANLLTNPHSLQHFEPFFAKSRTISEVATETGEKANTILARVRRLLALGLIEVVEERPRAGRSIKVYRSTADEYFIPYEATSAETLEAALASRDLYWEKLLRQQVVRARIEDVGSWGTRLYRDTRGRLYVQAALTPDKNYTPLAKDAPAVLSAWRDSVYLDFEDAKILQHELFQLLKKYQQKRGAQRYIIRLGMAPMRQ